MSGVAADVGWLAAGFDPWALLDVLLHRCAELCTSLSGTTDRFSLGQIVVALPFALLAWKLHHRRDIGLDLRAFLRFLAPRSVYLSRSAGLDLKLWLFNALVQPAALLLRAGGSLSVVAAGAAIAGALRQWFGPATQFGSHWLSIAVLGVLLLLATDFATYVTHRLSHEYKPFWAFHRVHHSALQLTPLTLLRKHPVYDALAVLLDIAIVAPLIGIITCFWAPEVGVAVSAVVATGFLIFSLFGSSLRHSHIWLSYGPVIERLFVSPALHQIHHSKADRHWDRNYGEVFALWDWMFGTLYLPHGHEAIEFGVNDHPDPHPTLGAALFEPFTYAWRAIRKRPAPAMLDPA